MRKLVWTALGALALSFPLWLSIALSFVLQCVVLYLPAMQRAFGTVALGPMDWARCIVAASAVFWVREAAKLVGGRKSLPGG